MPIPDPSLLVDVVATKVLDAMRTASGALTALGKSELASTCAGAVNAELPLATVQAICDSARGRQRQQ